MFARVKRYFALRKARKRFKLLEQMITSIDRAFVKKAVSRQARRQFWDEFVHDEAGRQRILKEMAEGFNVS